MNFKMKLKKFIRLLKGLVVNLPKSKWKDVKQKCGRLPLVRKRAYELASRRGIVGELLSHRKNVLILPEVLSGAHYAFNPTFSIDKTDFIFLVRTVDEKGVRHNSVVRMDSGLTLKGTTAAALGEESVVDWVADCRLFFFRNSRYVVFNTGHSEIPNRQFIQEVDGEFNRLSKPIPCLKTDGRRNVEKNWGFFEFQGELYCVYSVSPFVVLKAHLSNGRCELSECARHEWDASGYQEQFGELRGGASPFFHDGLFYYVVQSHIENFIGKIYSATILAFDPNRKFQPVAISTQPVFKLSQCEYFDIPRKMLNRSLEACLYPTGAAIIGEDFWISYGINDYKGCLKSYLLEDVIRCLDMPIEVI